MRESRLTKETDHRRLKKLSAGPMGDDASTPKEML